MATTNHVFRVLRVIEYRYDTAERMAEDMLNWTSQGSYNNMSFVSTTIPVEILNKNSIDLIGDLL